MKKIKRMLKRNMTIHYLYLVTKGIFSKEFKGKIVSLGREDSDEFHIKRYGNENIGKIVFLYDENSLLNGFFSIYRFMIETCWFSEKYGFVPVFHFGNGGFYGENGIEINGKRDAFEQYFQQPLGINYESAMNSYAVILSNSEKRDMIRKEIYNKPIEFLGYEIDEDYLKVMAEYAEKYIRLNPILKEQIDKDINDMIGSKRILAVHVRIKAFQKGLDRHPVAGSLDEYIEETKKAMKKGFFDQIFLATVEPDTIQAFMKEFGDQLIYFPEIQRSGIGEAIYEKSERKNHKYLLGYEALRDMYSLAYCDGLIAGLSQVSFCARITKLQLGKEFVYKKIIDHGINRSEYTVIDNLSLRK